MHSTLSARRHSAYKSGWSVVQSLLGWWLRDRSAAAALASGAPECTAGARARAPDQAWPPTIVDLHRTDCPAEKGPIRGSCDIPNYTDMKILPLFVLLACVAWQAYAQDDEPRAAPARGLLKRGPLAKGKTTTTTPAPEEGEYDEEDYAAEVDDQEAATEAAVTSTTESKKLVAGGVRPFRSNTDLLELLKRKRAQAAEAKLNGPASTAATQTQDNGAAEAAKSNYSAKGKKRFNNAPVTREVSDDEAPPAPAKPTRGRFGRPATRSVQEPEEEQNEPAPQARNSRNFRRGGN